MRIFRAYCCAVVVLAAFVLNCDAAWAANLPPGTYQCYQAAEFAPADADSEILRNPRFISGFCKYQARYGDQAFRNLLSMARKLVMTWNAEGGFDLSTIEPTEGMGQNTIVWWFSDQDSNIALGEMLARNDLMPRLREFPQVQIVTTMYSFERGYNRAFGVDVGAFYGRRELQEDPARFMGSLMGGIFSSSVGIGNPLASFLELGIQAARDKKRATIVTEVSNTCTVGTYCNYSHSKNFYIPHNVGLKDGEQVGITMSATPWIDAENPSLVLLQGLSLTYAIATDQEKSPVDIYRPYSSRDLMLRADQLYVLGNESTNVDVRTGKILGFQDMDAHSQFLILMKVSVLLPDGVKEAFPKYEQIKDDRAFTREEIEALPNGELTLEEIFDSIESVCFPDFLNPQNNEPICGFRFTKLDRKFMDYRVRFKIKKKLFGKGSFRTDTETEKVWPLSAVFEGKGYYQLPMFDHQGPASYVLTIELDDSNKIAKRLKKASSTKGVSFEFGYFPGSSDPVQFAPEFMKRIK